MALIVLCVDADTALAQEQESFLCRVDDETVVFCVEWETERPDIVFVAPDGETIYDPMIETEDTMTVLGETELYYYIESAPQGEWFIRYDKKSNESIYVYPVKQSGMFTVEDIRIENYSGNRLDVVFQTAYDTERFFNYNIYLTATPDERGVLVASGSDRTNNEIVKNVHLDGFGTYDNYYIYVYAWFNEDSVDIFDSAYSEPFSYVNPDSVQTQTEISLEINRDTCEVSVCWEPQWGYTYLIALFEDDSTEPLIYQEIEDTSLKSYLFGYTDGASKIRVEFSEKKTYRSAYSTPVQKTVDLKKAPLLFWENADLTNKNGVILNYEGFAQATALEISSDSRITTVMLQDKGSFTVELAEGQNVFQTRFEYGDEVYWISDKEIYNDSISPVLHMLEDYDGVTTSMESYMILGKVSDCAKLIIGSTEVSVEKDGTFCYELPLDIGENIVAAIASDLAGNQVMYQIVITRKDGPAINDEVSAEVSGKPGNTDSNEKNSDDLMAYLPLMIAGGIALLLFVLALIFWRRKTKPDVFKMLICGVGGIGILALILAGIDYFLWRGYRDRNTSLDFINGAYESIQWAADSLAGEESSLTRVFRELGTVGGCLGVMLILMAVRSVVRKHSKKDKE